MSAGAPSQQVPLEAPDAPPRPSGLVLQPFRALRYRSSDLAALTSPPYDVVDDDQVSALEQASPHNAVRLILPRGEGPDGQGRYLGAAQTLQAWCREGVLATDDRQALYVYEQAAPDGHVQRGLLGAVVLSQPEDGVVLPHENTMAGPVSDRLALYRAVDADLEPIFLLYDGGGAASDAVARVDAQPPLVDQVLPDGLRHRLWALTDPEQLAAVAADLLGRRAVIADGHHRYATYLQRQAERHAAGDGTGPWDAGLAFLVDGTAFGPQVHAIHRVVAGRSAAELAQQAATAWQVQDLDGQGLPEALTALQAAGQSGHAFLLAGGSGEVLRLLSAPNPDLLARALPTERSSAWRALDVSVLHAFLVSELWGLADTPQAVDFEHDVEAALAAARRTNGTAVLLNPTPASGVAAVAAVGDRMPRKSTLFTPKPRTGLVLRALQDQ